MLYHGKFDENSILIIKILILRHFPHILEILDSKYKTYIGYEIAAKYFGYEKMKM